MNKEIIKIATRRCLNNALKTLVNIFHKTIQQRKVSWVVRSGLTDPLYQPAHYPVL